MKITNTQGKKVDAVDVKFTVLEEHWNKYQCHDGSTIDIKLVVSRVLRTDEINPITSEPVYVVVSTNILNTIASADEEDAHVRQH